MGNTYNLVQDLRNMADKLSYEVVALREASEVIERLEKETVRSTAIEDLKKRAAEWLATHR